MIYFGFAREKATSVRRRESGQSAGAGKIDKVEAEGDRVER